MRPGPALGVIYGPRPDMLSLRACMSWCQIYGPMTSAASREVHAEHGAPVHAHPLPGLFIALDLIVLEHPVVSIAAPYLA